MAPKIVENCLEIRLGAPKGRSRALWIGPEGVQERSKRPPGGKNKGKIRASIAKRRPRGLQDPSGGHFGAILEPFWSHLGGDLGAIFELSLGRNPQVG